MQPRNLAARAGRWSATHRKTAVIGWILFVVLATVIGGKVGQKNLEPSAMGNGESKRGDMIVDAAGFPDTVGERVLIQGKGSIKADDPEVTAATKDVVHRLGQIDGVTDIQSPLDAQYRASTVSKDGRSVLVTFTLPGKAETTKDTEALETTAEAPLAAVAAVQQAHPDLRVEEHGEASEQKALGATERADEAKQTQISMGGTLILLLIAFGAAVAAGVPLLLGVSAFTATTGLLGPISQLSPLHEAVAQVTMLIGLAVGVDYAMFYMRRMMEEQDKGRSPADALDVAAATSGRAVLDLRVHRHGGDGRHVPVGQRDLLVVRHRHDPRRRRRHARVAHVPARGAVLPGPEGLAREGPRPVHRQAAPQDQGRVPRVERDPHPRPGPPGRSRSCSPAACSSRWRSRRSACSSRSPGRRACPAASRSSRRSTASTPPSRAAACRRTS